VASRDESGALRTLALVAVVVGLVALTTAACVLTYSSVHDFALRAGISPSLARIYPDIGDAMLVMAGCSVLALRGAGLLGKVYGWLCFIGLLGVLAGSSVVHEAGLNMPLRAAEITAAVFPWALVLVAFGLLLVLLRYAKRRRQNQRASSTLADTLASSRAALEPPALEAGAYEGTEGYDAEAYEGAGEYEGGEPYEYDEPATPELGVVSPTVPFPRASVEPDDAPAQPLRATIRPAEMQLRARTPRQLEPAESPPADSPTTEPPAAGSTAAGSTPPTGTPVTEPPTSGFTGDTIPSGELNPAPTSDQPSTKPPELDRPRSSPTPPS
jgi:Protein of unknown function (DUF2637)